MGMQSFQVEHVAIEITAFYIGYNGHMCMLKWIEKHGEPQSS